MTMFETSQAVPAEPATPPFSTAEMRSYPLGTLVYRAGLMSLEDVNRALSQAADSGRRLGEVSSLHFTRAVGAARTGQSSHKAVLKFGARAAVVGPYLRARSPAGHPAVSVLAGSI